MKNFEDKVYPLTKLEEKLLPAIKHLFIVRPEGRPMLGKENTISSNELIAQIENSPNKISIFVKCGLTEKEAKNYKLNRNRLSRFVKHLRVHHGLFIGCSSKGYWIANTPEEKEATINSFYERIIGSMISVRGLENINVYMTKDAIEYRKEILKLAESWKGYTP